ncbi:MAG: hypothetical protein JHC39_05530 [Lentimicrobium sp.]|jgi:hypothetical protein|nr:hypothetical protein [Lentimicrobium sp.]
MIKEIILGVLAIIWGIHELIDAYKSPPSDPSDSFLLIKFKGYVGGIGLITVGLFLIFDN